MTTVELRKLEIQKMLGINPDDYDAEAMNAIMDVGEIAYNLKEMNGIIKMNDYKVGDYIICVNGDSYELGRIKRVCIDGAFVCYHEGETAAKTPFDCMYKLKNAYTIQNTSLGGECFE